MGKIKKNSSFYERYTINATMWIFKFRCLVIEAIWYNYIYIGLTEYKAINILDNPIIR